LVDLPLALRVGANVVPGFSVPAVSLPSFLVARFRYELVDERGELVGHGVVEQRHRVHRRQDVQPWRTVGVREYLDERLTVSGCSLVDRLLNNRKPAPLQVFPFLRERDRNGLTVIFVVLYAPEPSNGGHLRHNSGRETDYVGLGASHELAILLRVLIRGIGIFLLASNIVVTQPCDFLLFLQSVSKEFEIILKKRGHETPDGLVSVAVARAANVLPRLPQIAE